MEDRDEDAIRAAMFGLASLKWDLLNVLRTPEVGRAEYEEIAGVIDFMEWIGATVAQVYRPLPEGPVPALVALFHTEMPLDSMSESPRITGLAHNRPMLPHTGFKTLPESGEHVRRMLAGRIESLATCCSDIGVATCARVQQLCLALGGADEATIRRDEEVREAQRRYPWTRIR